MVPPVNTFVMPVMEPSPPSVPATWPVPPPPVWMNVPSVVPAYAACPQAPSFVQMLPVLVQPPLAAAATAPLSVEEARAMTGQLLLSAHTADPPQGAVDAVGLLRRAQNKGSGEDLELLFQSLRILQVKHLEQWAHLAQPAPHITDLVVAAWALNYADVESSSRLRISQGQSRVKCCQGCGEQKIGHKRAAVHKLCPRELCWCGLPRLLHPQALQAGPTCRGEWRDMLQGRVAAAGATPSG